MFRRADRPTIQKILRLGKKSLLTQVKRYSHNNNKKY